MAKQKTADKNVEEIKALLKEGRVVIGSDTVIKLMRAGQIGKVMLASNCSSKTTATAEHYGRLAGVGVVRLAYPNDELGILCKKPFPISVLGVKR